MAKNFPASRYTFALIALANLQILFAQSTSKIFVEPRARIAAAPSVSEEPGAHLRVDASLVLIPANVSTDTGARINDLQKKNFKVFEDGVEQSISYFAMEDAPLSVGLLFDSSGSMRNKMRQAEQAAAEFFKTANREDEFFLVEFSDRAKLTVPFTADSGELMNRISRTRPAGRTSLLDAVQLALSQMKKSRNSRKAIVILSDGGDNRSRATYAQVKSSVMESDVQVYAMGIFDALELRKATREEQNGPQLLDELAAESGGKHFRAEGLDDLPAISARIGNELRSQYLVGYAPSSLQADGKYHKVKLQLIPPPAMPALRVRYRPGYYAPAR